MVLDVNQEVNLRLNADNRGLIAGTKGASTEIGKLNSSILGFDKTIVNNQSNLNNLKFSLDSIGQSANNFNQTIIAVPNQINKLESSTSGAASAVDAFNNANNIFLRIVAPKQVKTFETLTGVLNPVAKLHTDLAERTTTLGKAVELLGKVIIPFNKIIDTTQNTLNTLKESVKGINILGIDLYKTLNQFDEKLEFGQKLANFAVTADNARQQIAAFKEELGLFGQSVAETASAVGQNAGSIGTILKMMGPQLIGSLDDVGKKMGNVWVSMLGKAGKAVTGFQFQIMPLINIFKSISDSTILLSKQINELYRGFELFNDLGVDTSLAAMAEGMGTLGENLVFNIAKTKELTTVSMQMGEQFNAQVQYIRTLTAAQSYSVKELSGKLRAAVDDDLKNVVTAGELALSVYDNVSAGIGTAAGQIGEAVKQANAAVMLAKPTGASIQETQRLINFVSTAYKKTASESAEVASKLYQIVEQGVTNVSEMAANMGEVASVAAAMGISLENVSQSVAIATKTLGGDAYIAVKRLIESLSSMAPQSQKALQELGVTVDAQTLKTKGLFNTMQEIYKASQGNIETLKEIIPESIAFQGALTLMTSSTEDAANIMKSFDNASSESLQNLFDSQTESLTVRAERVKNAIHEVFTSAGQEIIDSGFFDQPLKAMEAFADRLKNMPEPVHKFIGAVIVLNQTIEKIVTVSGTFLASLTAIGLQLTFLYAFTQGGKLFSTFKTGFEGIVLAANNAGEKVSYLKASLQGISDTFNFIKKDIFTGMSSILKFTKPMADFLDHTHKSLSDVGKILITGDFKGAFKSLIDSFSFFNSNVSKQSANTIVDVKNAILDLTALGDGSYVYNSQVNKKSNDIVDSIKQTFNNPEVKKSISDFKSKFSELSTNFKEIFNIKDDGLIDDLKNSGLQIKESLTNIFKDIKTSILGNFTDIGSSSTNVFTKLTTSYKNFIDNISNNKNNLKNQLSSFINDNKTLGELFDNTSAKVKSMFANTKIDSFKIDLPKFNFKDLTETFKNGFKNINSIVLDNISHIKKSFDNIVSSDFIKRINTNLNVIEDSFKNAFSSIQNSFKQFNWKDLKIDDLKNLGSQIKQSFDSGSISVKTMGSTLLETFKKTAGGSAAFGTLNGILVASKAIMSGVGVAAKAMWSSVLAPLLPIAFIVGLLGVIRDFIPAFGSVTEKSNSFVKSLTNVRNEAGNLSKDVAGLRDELGKKTGESAVQFNSFLNKFVLTPIRWLLVLPGQISKLLQNIISSVLGAIPIIGKPLQFLFNTIINSIKLITGTIDALGTGVKWITDNILSKIPLVGGLFKGLGDGFKVITSGLHSITGETKQFENSITSLQNSIENSFGKETLVAVNNFLDVSTKKTKEFNETLAKTSDDNPFEGLAKSATAEYKDYEKAINDLKGKLGNSEDDREVRKQLDEKLKAKKEETEKFIASEKEYQNIISKAREENRSLTAKEVTDINTKRKEAFDYRKNLIKEELAFVEAQYEKMKDMNPEAAGKLKERMDVLNKEITAEETRLSMLSKQTQTLNEFTKQINRETKLITDSVGEANKEFDDQATLLNDKLSKGLKDYTKDQQQANQTNLEATNKFKDLIAETESFSTNIEKSGGKINYFQQRTLNGFIGSVKELGKSLDDINSDTFDPAEFRGKIQSAVDSSMDIMEQFADNPEMSEKVLDTLKNTEVSYVDETGKAIKTTLEKTLSPEQLQQLIEVRLSIIDKVSEKEQQKLADNNNEIDKQHQEHFAKLSKTDENYAVKYESTKLQILEKQNQNNNKSREIEIKAANDKLAVIEKEFGKETTQYKEQYRKLEELQKTHKDTTLTEQKNLLDERYRVFELNLNTEQIALETSLDNQDISMEEYAQKSKELTESDFKEKEEKLKQEIQLAKDNGESSLELENQYAQLRLDKQKKLREDELNIIEEKYNRIEKEIERSIIAQQALMINGTTTKDETKLAELNAKQRQAKIDSLKEQIEIEKKVRGDMTERVIELESQLQQEVTEQQKEALEQQLKAIKDFYDKIDNEIYSKSLQARRAALDGETIAEVKFRQKNDTAELESKAKNIKEQIKLYQVGSKERIELEKQLRSLEVDLAEKALKNKEELMQKEVDLKVAQINKLKAINEKETILGANIDDFKKQQALQEKELKLHIDITKEKIKQTQVGTQERLQLETELINKENELLKSQVEFRKQILDDQYRKDKFKLTEKNIKNQRDLLNGQTQEELKSQLELSEKQIELDIKNTKEKIKLTKEGSQERLELTEQLLNAELELEKQQIEKRKQLLQDNFEKEQDLIKNELTKFRLKELDGLTLEEMKQRQKIQTKELESTKRNLQEQLKLYEKGSKERRKIEQQLLETEVQLQQQALEQKKEILEKEFNLKQGNIEKLIELEKRQLINGTTTEELDKIDDLEKSKLETRINYLKEQIKLTQAGTEERLQLETELEQTITEIQSKEQEKRKRKIEEKYQDLNRNLEKDILNKRKQLLNGSTLDELNSINNLEKNTIETKLKSLKEQLSLYEKNSKEYKDIQQQILQAEFELEEKKVQIKKDTLDKKLELEIALLEKVKIANEELSLDGISQSDLDKIQEANKKELEIKINNIQEQIKLYQKGSIERIRLENELQQTLLQNKKNELEYKKQKIDNELTLEKNKLQEIKLLNEKNSIRGSTQENLKRTQQLQEQEIQLTINNLNTQLELYETNSKERKEIELQLQQELNNLERSKFESQKQIIQQRFDEEQRLNNDSKNNLEQLLISNSISREQYDKQNINLQKESLLNEQELFSQQLNIYKQGSKEYYDVLAQMSNKQLEYQKLVIEESVSLLERQKQQIDINTETSKQNIEKVSQAQDRYISNLEFESKMKQSDLDITKSLMNAEISRLELNLTQTGDLVEKAEINLQIKQKQIAISNKEIEVQIENLNQQTKINKLNLEKEKIQIRLNKLDIERNTLQTQLEIKQAKLQNKSKEEITILEQQLDSLKNQSSLLDQREQDLIRNNALEEKITENKLKELEIQQDINAERSQNELEIAQQEKLLAILETQKQQVLYRYEKSIEAQEKELKALDHIQKVEESRLKSLQQRQSTLNELMGLFDTSTQMASEGAVSEAKRDHLAKKNAEMKYKMLQISQNIERQNLEMEMKQAEIANKRLQIEHERAKLTAQSNLRQAEFDAKRILMDKTASDIDKQRAMDLIESRKDELVFLDQQSSLIEDQISLTNQGLADRRKLIDFKQGIEDLQARSTIAKTTKNTADDVAISNEAFNMTNVLEKTLTANMNQFKEIQTPTIEINRKMEATLSRLNNTIEKQIKTPQTNTPVNVSKLADININLNDKNVSAAVPDIKRQIYDALNNVVVAANQQNITPSF